MSIEKVEILKTKIHMYKEKMKVASNCTIDMKRKAVQRKSTCMNIGREESQLDATFLSENQLFKK